MNINAYWRVEPCPCGHPACKSAIIEPYIVTLQGSMDREYAEHVVELHNKWVDETSETRQVTVAFTVDNSVPTITFMHSLKSVLPTTPMKLKESSRA